MTFEQSRLRSDLLGTQVITRNGGKRLGIISQLWVDVDRGEVVALGLRENILSSVVSSTEQVMLLSSIRQIGDVILVDDEDAIEDDISIAPYSTLVRCEVITEAGESLGRVRGFKFDMVTGKIESLVIASLGLPQIPDQVVSTYELPIDEIVSSGPDRLIVFEGAEEKLVQVTVGILERLGIGSPPWERDAEDAYMMPVSTSNQLTSGSEVPIDQTLRERPPVTEERWSDDDWNQSEPLPMNPMPRQEAKLEAYADDLEEDNWSDATPPQETYATYETEDDDVTGDVWSDDDVPEPYEAPPVNLPQKKKVTEYEEELDY
ncbi:MAG: PRC-barrel domain containing protein [Leptolyngbyaceae cyanobacterium SL_1_1]|nr:PRC-barrel domain containing protein [Leptolyngbyaceae cyanobacterium RM1_1_2]NJO08604.1 PRC-barrel domain containing protein [Leptolyngbyaceae cyanobacterium SL_1_1]